MREILDLGRLMRRAPSWMPPSEEMKGHPNVALKFYIDYSIEDNLGHILL